jgi:hypothetical protein
VLYICHLFSTKNDSKDPDYRHSTGRGVGYLLNVETSTKVKWYLQLVGHSARCAETLIHICLDTHGIRTSTGEEIIRGTHIRILRAFAMQRTIAPH